MPLAHRIALVALVALLANANVLTLGFVWDDHYQIEQNPTIRSLGNIPGQFRDNVWAFQGNRSNYYRPLMYVIFTLAHAAGGLEPFCYHLANLLLHVGCALLVLALGTALPEMLDARAAAAAAILFAAHPIHTEAIAWVGAVTEPSFAILALGSALLFVRGHPVGSALLFFGALLGKETAVTLLPILVALEHLGKPAGSPRRYLPHLVALAAYLAVRVAALGALLPVPAAPPPERGSIILSTLCLAGTYVRKLVLPWPFSVWHLRHLVESPLDPALWTGAAWLAGLAATMVVLWRRGNTLWLAGLWILAPLAPVLSFHAGGLENAPSERYLYLPSVGFCWLVAALIARFPIAVALLALNYGAMSLQRNLDWKDDVALWSSAREQAPSSLVVAGNLATAHVRQGRPAEALPLLLELAREKPRDAANLASLGVVQAMLGDLPRAQESLERSLALEARPTTFADLGRVRERAGDAGGALAAYRRALAAMPGDADLRARVAALEGAATPSPSSGP